MHTRKLQSVSTGCCHTWRLLGACIALALLTPGEMTAVPQGREGLYRNAARAIEALSSGTPLRRVEAALALATMGDRARIAVPALTTLLGRGRGAACPDSRGRRRRLRLAAVGAIDRLSGPMAVHHLIAALDDREVEVQRAAAIALARRHDPRVFEVLRAVAHDRDSPALPLAIGALAAEPDPGVTTLLFNALADRDAAVRSGRQRPWALKGTPVSLPCCDSCSGIATPGCAALGGAGRWRLHGPVSVAQWCAPGVTDAHVAHGLVGSPRHCGAGARPGLGGHVGPCGVDR